MATPRPRPHSPRRPWPRANAEERLPSASRTDPAAADAGGRLAEAERAFASSVTGWREAGDADRRGAGTGAGRRRRAQGRLDAAVPTSSRPWYAWSRPAQSPPAGWPSYVALAEIAISGTKPTSPAVRRRGASRRAQFRPTVPLANGRPPGDDPAGHRDPAATPSARRGRPTSPAGPADPVPPSGPGRRCPRATCPARPFPAETGLGRTMSLNYARQPGQLAPARVLLAQDRPEQALAPLGLAARRGGSPGPDRSLH